jgi:hypothetical protein
MLHVINHPDDALKQDDRLLVACPSLPVGLAAYAWTTWARPRPVPVPHVLFEQGQAVGAQLVLGQ